MEKVQTTIRLTAKQKADVERIAKRLGISINAVIVLAIGEYIARLDKKKVGDSVG